MTIIAGGPSLSAGDVATARFRTRVVAVNDAWSIAGADLLYAADAAWWNHHQGVPEFGGEKWTQDKDEGNSQACGREQLLAADRWGLHVVRSELRPGLSFEPECIHQGFNGGFQALNLAVLFGASRIVLLGFDCQATAGRSHWFGDHPMELRRTSPYPLFVEAFAAAAPQLAGAGIEVVNCSRETSLTCFPRAALEDAL